MDLNFCTQMLQIVGSSSSGPSKLMVDKSSTSKVGPPLPLQALVACSNVTFNMVALNLQKLSSICIMVEDNGCFMCTWNIVGVRMKLISCAT
uniref:Uncharacterized protein n=1 Tax=Ditylenchus dipsaci TaxID=166011 RepID=A0A915E3P0_9BILA